MRRFHNATVVEKRREADDAICLTLSVPPGSDEEFKYSQGQHLPIKARVGDKNLRRTYSICSSVGENLLRLGIRVQPEGRFSNYIADQIEVGDVLEIMPPSGHFYTELDPSQRRVYAAFVAGSGITPILSIAKTTLETESESQFFIFYGNRKKSTTMFIEELYGLKNRFPERLSLHFVMSQEPSELSIYGGRVDGAKAAELYQFFLQHTPPDEVFVCGPNPMIDQVSEALVGLGVPTEHIHSERFRGIQAEQAPVRRARVSEEGTEIGVTLDGHRQSFRMTEEHPSILAAAQAAGLDLPFSCTGGVCSTCRTLLRKGEVDMAVNYALEPWELDSGYILTCQATPKSDVIEIDYDQA